MRIIAFDLREQPEQLSMGDGRRLSVVSEPQQPTTPRIVVTSFDSSIGCNDSTRPTMPAMAWKLVGVSSYETAQSLYTRLSSGTPMLRRGLG